MKYLRVHFYLYFLFLFSLFSNLNAQVGFKFAVPENSYEKLDFDLINNLIVLPLKVNGQELSFILDTGVSKTILFNLAETDSIGLNNVEKVSLQGLGGGEPVEALLSKNNTIELGDLLNTNESIYVVLRDYFDLSEKMGTTIHGIIGYSLLRNFKLKINYTRETIQFYKSKKGEIEDCRKCELFPIQFYRKKPYLDAFVQLDTIGDKLTLVKLLIDSGGSDALWLFEGTKKNIKTPLKSFKDVLGEGLSGTIYGNRSRIKNIKLKSFNLKSPTVSFLDSLSTANARVFESRNGSLGGGILKRFTVWLDYRNKAITLKKNSNFNKKFDYNMSGLYVAYNGKQLIRQKDAQIFTDGYKRRNYDVGNSISFVTSFSYRFKPSFKVQSVVEGSPAHEAGLQKNDIIKEINGTPAYDYDLVKINSILRSRENRKIFLVIEREGKLLKKRFKLERRL